MNSIRVVFADDTMANHPDTGGHWMCSLQYLLA